MRISKKHISILIPVIVILIAAGAFASSSLRKNVTAIPETNNDKEQDLILKELSALLHSMDTITVTTIAGTIDARDLADSSADMHTEFMYSRNGNTAYYRIGETEMISLKEGYIAIVHDVKKIFLSPPKEVVNPVKVSLNAEIASLKKEGYKVSRKPANALTEISLLNKTHITCREYHVAFDSTGVIRKMNTRFTDPAEPKDRERDKLLDLNIHTWQNKANAELLRMDHYIINGVPVKALQGYELIREY